MFLLRDPDEKLGVSDLLEWLDELGPGQLEDDDRYHAKELLYSICMAWRYLSLNLGATSREDAHRKAVDDLIAWAFQMRPNVKQFFQLVCSSSCLSALMMICF